MADPVPIRAIVGRFSQEYSHQAIEEVLRERPFAFCAIVAAGAEPRYFSGIPQSCQEWFISSEIRGCTYRNVDAASLRPLDEVLIGQMRECEAIFMTMVSRLEWKRQFSYEMRKRWYLRHLRFWNDYIERHGINLYLSAWTPHEIPDIIIYYLCKRKGIRVLFFECANVVLDTSFAEHDWEESAGQIDVRYTKLLQEHTDTRDPSQVPLHPHYEERYQALTQAVGSKPPAFYYSQWKSYWALLYRTIWEKPLILCQTMVRYCTPGGLKRAFAAAKRYWVSRTYNAFYNACAIEPDFDRPFVYLPLHFQPELATTPMGGGFGDQILVAQMLQVCLPDDVLIYVKEHPWESAWTVRSIQYYRDFLELPKVRLVARSADTFALREHCRAVATVTGTAGMEALFRGKPVFLFGHRFYQYARGVYRIHSYDDCVHAVREVFVEGKKPTSLDCRLYLKAMEETRVHGVIDPDQIAASPLSHAVHSRVHTEAILRELRQWFN